MGLCCISPCLHALPPGCADPAGAAVDPVAACSYLLCALVLVGTTVAPTRRGAIGWSDAAFGALVVTFPNSGFMGIPLLAALLGAQQRAVLILTLALDMVVTVTSLCIACRAWMASAKALGGFSAQGLRGIAVNPCPGRLRWGAGLVAAVAAAANHRADGGHAWRQRPRRWRCSPWARCWHVRIMHLQRQRGPAPVCAAGPGPHPRSWWVAQPLLLWLLGQAAQAFPHRWMRPRFEPHPRGPGAGGPHCPHRQQCDVQLLLKGGEAGSPLPRKRTTAGDTERKMQTPRPAILLRHGAVVSPQRAFEWLIPSTPPAHTVAVTDALFSQNKMLLLAGASLRTRWPTGLNRGRF